MNFFNISKKKKSVDDVFTRLVEKINNDNMKLPFAEVNDSMKCIVDIETSKIVWMDEGLKSKVGGDRVGEICYTVLQGCTHPCDFCVNHNQLKENEVMQTVNFNKDSGRVYLVRDFMRIVNERKLRYEMSIDITSQLTEINNYGQGSTGSIEGLEDRDRRK